MHACTMLAGWFLSFQFAYNNWGVYNNQVAYNDRDAYNNQVAYNDQGVYNNQVAYNNQGRKNARIYLNFKDYIRTLKSVFCKNIN